MTRLRDIAAHLRRLWRLPADMAQAETATWRSADRLSDQMAALAGRHDPAGALDALRAELVALRQEVAALRATSAARAVPVLDAGTLSDLQLTRSALEALRERAEHLHDEHTRRLLRLEDLGFDQLALLARGQPSDLRLVAERPVALDSADHLHPRGTAADDTRHPRFVSACEALFPGRTLHHLDLGCAGGGLVWDFLSAGHQSWGVEGSDYSQRARRAYWRVAPGRYFTADITRPFQLIRGDGRPAIFEVITAWEVLEHIAEADLPTLFGTIRTALTADGLFVASISTLPEAEGGVVWHATLRDRAWWLARAAENGLVPSSRGFDAADFPRGSGNPRSPDLDFRRDPAAGFHLVLQPAA